MLLTTICYIEQDGKYLMLLRNKKKQDVNEGKWIGVGGKFLEGESPEECLLREVREETGLILMEYRYRGLVTFVSDRWEGEYMHLFTASAWTDGKSSESDSGGQAVPPEETPRECAEGVLEWIPKRKLLSLPMWEGDAIFLRLLEEDAPFFSLKLHYQGEHLLYAALNGKAIQRP